MASLALLLLIRFWQPVLNPIWAVDSTSLRAALQAMFWAGWTLVFASTILIDHFELFGVKHVWSHFKGEPHQPAVFCTPGPYKLVRPPLYLGFIVAFWSAPTMTAGHVFFAVMTTAYILVATQSASDCLSSCRTACPSRVLRAVHIFDGWPMVDDELATSAAVEPQHWRRG